MINLIFNAIMALLDFILGFFLPLIGVPDAPVAMQSAIGLVSQWINAGLVIVDWIVPIDAINPAIDIFIVTYGGRKAYDLILWIVNKIPALDVD